MNVDIIMPSNAKSNDLRCMTQATIDSCHASSRVHKFDIRVYEQNKLVRYDNAITLYYDFEFNYNKVLNLGIRESRNRYIALCNNDLRFDQGWFENLKVVFDNYDYLSLSPLSIGSDFTGNIAVGDYLLEGYRCGYHLAGWCIVVDRSLFNIIGSLDESVNFYYSDNIYLEQLKKHGVKHALVCNSLVKHLTSRTLVTVRDRREFNNLTDNNRLKFERRLREYAKMQKL